MLNFILKEMMFMKAKGILLVLIPLVLLCISLTLSSQLNFAYAEDEEEIVIPGQKKSVDDPLENVLALEGTHGVQEFTGAATFSYPIFAPPGRKDLTPSVSLNYSSVNRDINTILGMGWDLNTMKIIRFSRTGPENLYTGNRFISPFAGGNGELVPETVDGNGYGTYKCRVVSQAVK